MNLRHNGKKFKTVFPRISRDITLNSILITEFKHSVLQGIEGIKKKLSEYSQIRNMLVQKLPNEMSQYVSISSLFDRKARLTEELQVLDEKLEEIKLQNHKTELELQTKYEMKNKYLQTSNMKVDYLV